MAFLIVFLIVLPIPIYAQSSQTINQSSSILANIECDTTTSPTYQCDNSYITSGDNRIGYVKFNKNDIVLPIDYPKQYQIIGAYLNLYLFYDNIPDINYSTNYNDVTPISYCLNQTWTDSDNDSAMSCENNFSAIWINASQVHQWYLFNVTDTVKSAYANTSVSNITFLLKKTVWSTPTVNYYYFSSRDHVYSGGLHNPQLILYYDILPTNYTYLEILNMSYSYCNYSNLITVDFIEYDGNNHLLKKNIYCDSGCDNITMTCNAPIYQQNIGNFVIIIIIIVFFIFIYAWAKRRR